MGRELRVVCLSELARTWQTFFDLPRYDLYGLQYTEDVIVPESELAIRNPLYSGSILGGMFPFFPTDEVYGVETDEGRYSVIQVVDVRMDHIMVKYKTFETDTPNAQLSGGVLSSQPAQIAATSNSTVGIDIKRGEAQFVPAVISGALGCAAPRCPSAGSFGGRNHHDPDHCDAGAGDAGSPKGRGAGHPDPGGLEGFPSRSRRRR